MIFSNLRCSTYCCRHVYRCVSLPTHYLLLIYVHIGLYYDLFPNSTIILQHIPRSMLTAYIIVVCCGLASVDLATQGGPGLSEATLRNIGK